MGTIVVGGAVVVVCVGGYYRYLRSPSDEGLQPKDEEVTEWQLDLPGIETTLQMARLATKLTCTSRGLRTVRTGYAPASCVL